MLTIKRLAKCSAKCGTQGTHITFASPLQIMQPSNVGVPVAPKKDMSRKLSLVLSSLWNVYFIYMSIHMLVTRSNFEWLHAKCFTQNGLLQLSTNKTDMTLTISGEKCCGYRWGPEPMGGSGNSDWSLYHCTWHMWTRGRCSGVLGQSDWVSSATRRSLVNHGRPHGILLLLSQWESSGCSISLVITFSFVYTQVWAIACQSIAHGGQQV